MKTIDISRMRLLSQGLVKNDSVPNFESATHVVQYMQAVQGQDLPGALLSVAMRLSRPNANYAKALRDVHEAFNQGELVRTWPQRGTLHFLPTEDLHWYLSLTAQRKIQAEEKRRLSRHDLLTTDVDRARNVVVNAIAQAPERRLRRSEIVYELEKYDLIKGANNAYYYLYRFSVEGLIAFGPLYSPKEQYLVLTEDLPRIQSNGKANASREDLLRHLIERFVISHGPVTVRDIAWWSALGLTEIRKTLADLHDAGVIAPLMDVKGTVQNAVGECYWVAPDLQEIYSTQMATTARSLLLLPGYDELMLGYTDRTHTTGIEHLTTIDPARNGIFKKTIVSGGRLIGLWTLQGAKKTFTPSFLEPVSENVQIRVSRLAERLPRE
ncbi:winged helix DNA-binding domain-containing protein [Arcanobacterium ihumii]|uniref:winged helix DNA-binding domain-containing protein n=1 Tax=Arcanobacterium ihumii TaxID=2138162 RepID=UPI000F534766|nr:winged helix DNA-binding domain-containing protein [Arcanobacterium ihumii]